MSKYNIHNIDNRSLFEGAKLCVRNAANLYEKAISIEDENNYGTSNSLLILSIEEAIKSVLLMAKSLNLEILFDIEPVLRNHLKKHEQDREFFTVLLAIKTMLLPFSKKPPIRKFFEIIIELNSLFSKNEKERFSKWWENANIKKNQGLYVDLKDGEWISPDKTTKEDYFTSRDIAYNFFHMLSYIKDLEWEDYEELSKNNKNYTPRL